MTEERALREIIKDAWCAGDLNPTDKFGDFLNRSAKRIKEAGYRLPGGKAPLLTDEEFFEWCGTHYIKNCRGTRKMIACDRVVSICEDCRAQAQRDADNKFFGVK